MPALKDNKWFISFIGLSRKFVLKRKETIYINQQNDEGINKTYKVHAFYFSWNGLFRLFRFQHRQEFPNSKLLPAKRF